MIEELAMRNNVSGYAGLKSISRKPNGGFCFVRVRTFLAAWIRFKREEITLYDLRIWLACHEMLARRCQVKGDRLPTYTEEELISLVGSGTKSEVKRGIQRLVAAGLLQWERNCISTDTLKAEAALADSDDYLDALALIINNKRKIPVPRRILRHVIKTRNRTLIGTVFGHLFRCLYYRRDRCISGGKCKSSFVAEALQLDLRNVKAARKQLIQLGWILPGNESQISLNRWGLPVVINLQWEDTKRTEELKTPPLEGQNEAKTPPLIDRELSYSKRSINQKTQRSTGVKNKQKVVPTPNLKHIALEDLRDSARLDLLYREATQAGSLRHSEFNRLQWFAAAEHALAVGKQNPCGLFAAIYRQKLWRHITHDQEDIARAKLKRLDFGEESHLPGEMCRVVPDYESLAA